MDLVFKRLAFFGAESAKFGLLLLLAKLTPAMSFLVEFLGEKRRKSVIGITFATGNLSGRFFWSILGSLRPSGANGAGFRAI